MAYVSLIFYVFVFTFMNLIVQQTHLKNVDV